jgi:hypothetical protein
VTVREKVGVALNSGNLMASDIAERPVDRVGALGMANWLGRELFHLKYAQQMTGTRKRIVVHFVARRLARPKPPSDILLRVAYLALEAWLYDRCPICGGRKFVGGDRQNPNEPSSVRPCPRCEATGRLVLRDHDVARVLQIPVHQVSRWDLKLRQAHDILTWADLRAAQVVERQLRRP